MEAGMKYEDAVELIRQWVSLPVSVCACLVLQATMPKEYSQREQRLKKLFFLKYNEETNCF